MNNNLNDLDVENINVIDMECSCCDDDDFGGPVKTITADVTPNNTLNIQKHNFNNNSNSEEDYSQYNQIDMECNIDEDELEETSFGSKLKDVEQTVQYPVNQGDHQGPVKTGIILNFDDNDDIDIKSHKQNILDFGDEENDFMTKELVDEEILEEKKKKKHVTSAQIEDDYWEKITKAHQKSIVPGARGTFVHMSGNPELEKDMFNHDMGSDSIMKVGKLNADGTPALSSVGGGFGSAASVGANGGDVSVGISSGFAGGESIEKDNDYNKLCEDLLFITGFTVDKNEDGTYTLKDILSDNNYNCSNNEEIFNQLKPYIDDCFIYPLQIKTGNNFNTCKEWCDWYNDDMKAQYPDCESDIKYCDLIANHYNDFKF